MIVSIEHQGRRYAAESSESTSLAITLDFDGPQPNFFAADAARRAALQLGDFVGRTRRGGSCNVDVVELIPHCNGTHTETVSHIVDQEVWIGRVNIEPLMPAVLISVAPKAADQTGESYRPALGPDDVVVTADRLRAAFQPFASLQPAALILRTLPNPIDKLSRAYSADNAPPFLTVEAMQWINSLPCRHLLLDLPSVDRMDDEGRLTNHHIFWNVPGGTHGLGESSWPDKTITEMIYAGDASSDGPYLLNLQVPAWCSDAAPSRPVIMPIRR